MKNVLADLINHDANNNIHDEYSNDGDGYFDIWTSTELTNILNKAKELLNQ